MFINGRGRVMKYGYARVSTAGQDLESQIEMLKSEGCEKIFSEHFTGTKADRPQFQQLLSELKMNDTLVVTKLDRFARSAEDAIHIIKKLLNDGIKVHVLNMGLVDNTPTGKLILTIMSGFAEFERDMIVQRTQEGKAIAKKNNPDFREGRPKKFGKKTIEHALELLGTHSYNQVAEITGISKSTLVRAKRNQKDN